jgi:hypothetical protein
LSIRIHDLCVGHHYQRVACVKKLTSDGDLVWLPDVILIRQKNILSPSQGKGTFKGRARTAIRFVQQQSDSRIIHMRNQIDGAIEGAIINDDDLIVIRELRQDRSKLLFKIALTVEYRHANGNHLACSFLNRVPSFLSDGL